MKFDPPPPQSPAKQAKVARGLIFKEFVVVFQVHIYTYVYRKNI